MASLKSVVPRLDDKTVINLFREMQSLIAPQGMYLQVAGVDQVNLMNPSQPIVDTLDRSGTYLITTAALNYPNLNIYYHRNPDGNRPNPFYDEIHIDHNNNPGPMPEERLKLIEFLNSRVTLGQSNRNDIAAQSIEGLQQVYHSTVLKLETAFAEQIGKITDWTVEQTSALEQHKLNLTEETAEERKQLTKEFEGKAELLRAREDELEVRKRELDDRAHMHARRGFHIDMRKTIKERQTKFTLTPETRRLRLPVHVVMVALLVALAAVNFVTLEAILRLDLEKASLPVLAWTFGKQTLATLAFVAALFFYIRWMNRWFEQHASAEFLLKQFELDIDRASWVVESAMEWRDQKTEIPAPLLEGITRNLFSDRGSSTDTHSAADDLASALVGNASQLKVKMGDNELSFDRKGLAGLDKTEVRN